jgi:hypothetical protein
VTADLGRGHTTSFEHRPVIWWATREENSALGGRYWMGWKSARTGRTRECFISGSSAWWRSVRLTKHYTRRLYIIVLSSRGRTASVSLCSCAFCVLCVSDECDYVGQLCVYLNRTEFCVSNVSFLCNSVDFYIFSDLNIIFLRKYFSKTNFWSIHHTRSIAHGISFIKRRHEYRHRKHEDEGYTPPSLRDWVQEHEVPDYGPAYRPDHPQLHSGKLFTLSLRIY